MTNFDYATGKNIKRYNPNWHQIADHPSIHLLI